MMRSIDHERFAAQVSRRWSSATGDGLDLTAMELHRPVRFPRTAAVSRERLRPLRIATRVGMPGEAHLDGPPIEGVVGVEEADVVGKGANDRDVEVVRRTSIEPPDGPRP